MASTYLTIPNLPTLPETADNFLTAGWFSVDAAPAVFTALKDVGSAGIGVLAKFNDDSVQWQIYALDSSGIGIFYANITIPFDLAAPGRHSYAISVQIAAQVIQILLDTAPYTYDSMDPSVTWSSTNPVALFPGSDPWIIGQADSGAVSVSDFRFGAGEGAFDLSDEGNARRLFTVDNKPVNWGDSGGLVTGFVPAVFLHGEASVYADNLGSGGPFTLLGLLVDALEICQGLTYRPPAVLFNNSGDPFIHVFLSPDALTTLPSSADTFLLAGWIGHNAAFDQWDILIPLGPGGVVLTIFGPSDGIKEWVISAFDDVNDSIFTVNFTLANNLDGWVSFAISGRMSTQTLQFMVNRVLYDPLDFGITWNSTNPIDYSSSPAWNVLDGGDTRLSASDLRFGSGEPFYDLGEAVNQDKLFASGNKPVFWGMNGELVTNAIPAMYLHGNSSSYPNNLGSGGPCTLFQASGPPPLELLDFTPPPL